MRYAKIVLADSMIIWMRDAKISNNQVVGYNTDKHGKKLPLALWMINLDDVRQIVSMKKKGFELYYK